MMMAAATRRPPAARAVPPQLAPTRPPPPSRTRRAVTRRYREGEGAGRQSPPFWRGLAGGAQQRPAGHGSSPQSSGPQSSGPATGRRGRAPRWADGARNSWQGVRRAWDDWPAERRGSALAWVAGGAAALWLTGRVVEAVDALPIVPGALKLVGLTYTLWFYFRYVLLAEGRRDLAALSLDKLLGRGAGPGSGAAGRGGPGAAEGAAGRSGLGAGADDEVARQLDSAFEWLAEHMDERQHSSGSDDRTGV